MTCALEAAKHEAKRRACSSVSLKPATHGADVSVDSWSTLGLPGLLVKEGRFYFEVELLGYGANPTDYRKGDGSAVRVGWLTPAFTRQLNKSVFEGVGDDRHGWAAD